MHYSGFVVVAAVVVAVAVAVAVAAAAASAAVAAASGGVVVGDIMHKVRLGLQAI